MAILANINEISSMFEKDALAVLLRYLRDTVDINSEIYKRILGLDCSDGRVEMKFDLGYGMIAIEQSYTLGGDICFESHKKYVDFQLVVCGSECMQVGQRGDFKQKIQYDEKKDMILYDNPSNTPSTMILYPQTLLVLFPCDIHAGGIKANDDIVFKSVVKVPNSLLECRF